MTRVTSAVVLLALLCSSGALASPLRMASTSSSRRELKGFGHGFLASHVLNSFAHRWFVRRGITPFGGAAAFATATATASAAPSLDPSFSSMLGTNALAAARAIATGGVDMDSAAWSLASAAAGGSAAGVGDVFAATAGLDGPLFTNVYVRAAAMAMAEGGSMATGFQAATAAAFASAGAQGSMAPFALAAADALVQARSSYGSDFYSEFTGMFGAAMAQAVAAGNGAAVAEATAAVFCNGTGAQAEAWSQAISQSVTVDPATGCLILTRAVARAQATCVNGVATASAQSSATRRLLGACNVFPASASTGMATAFAMANANSGFGGFPTGGVATARAAARANTVGSLLGSGI